MNLISDILDDYKSYERCFIIGKGASVDKVNLNNLRNELTICINDSFKFIPNPKLIFFHDKIFFENNRRNLSELHNAKFIVPFLLNDFKNNFKREKILSINYISIRKYPNVYFYNKFQTTIVELLLKPNFLNKIDKLDNTLVGLSGTLISAIHFAHKLNIKKVNLIGIDGCNFLKKQLSYSKKFSNIKVSNKNCLIYNIIKFEALFLLKYFNISYKFLGINKHYSSKV